MFIVLNGFVGRDAVVKLLAQLKESLSLLDQLKVSIETKHMCYDGVCGRVQSAGTPKQAVRFLLWLAKNYKMLAKHIPPNYPCKNTSSSAAMAVAETSRESASSGAAPPDENVAVSLTSSLSYMATPSVQGLLPSPGKDAKRVVTAVSSSSTSDH